MTCGIDLNIASLDVLKDALDSEIQGLISAAGGLGTNINAIKALATTQMAGIVSELAGALPSLSSLIPSSTLISDMTGLLGLISNPAAFALQATAIALKYGDVPGVDISKLANSILSGDIGLDSICSLIPNVEIDALNNVIKKGIIPLPPTAAVPELPDIFNGSLQASAESFLKDATAATAKASAALTEIVRNDGIKMFVLPDSITITEATGGIEAAAAALGLTLSGKTISAEVKTAFLGLPDIVASASASQADRLSEYYTSTAAPATSGWGSGSHLSIYTSN